MPLILSSSCSDDRGEEEVEVAVPQGEVLAEPEGDLRVSSRGFYLSNPINLAVEVEHGLHEIVGLGFAVLVACADDVLDRVAEVEPEQFAQVDGFEGDGRVAVVFGIGLVH